MPFRYICAFLLLLLFWTVAPIAVSASIPGSWKHVLEPVTTFHLGLGLLAASVLVRMALISRRRSPSRRRSHKASDRPRGFAEAD